MVPGQVPPSHSPSGPRSTGQQVPGRRFGCVKEGTGCVTSRDRSCSQGPHPPTCRKTCSLVSSGSHRAPVRGLAGSGSVFQGVLQAPEQRLLCCITPANSRNLLERPPTSPGQALQASSEHVMWETYSKMFLCAGLFAKRWGQRRALRGLKFPQGSGAHSGENSRTEGGRACRFLFPRRWSEQRP